MVNKGRIIPELRWPNTPEFTKIANIFANNVTVVLLRYVWEAYDLLKIEVLSQINVNQAEDELERSITQLLEPRIHRVMTGDEPFYVQHGSYENETRKPPPAQPPEYDIAFVLSGCPRVMWPLEAKVLISDKAVSKYVKDVNNEFIKCRYAPFSKEGGMIGYLFSGDPNITFLNIANSLNCSLYHHPAFPKRPHKTSNHKRKVPKGKPYPSKFCCHHLILQLEP